VIRGCIARPEEENISPDFVAVLNALQQQEARQPRSVAVRVGRHKLMMEGKKRTGER
jgi:hypothetical protein